MKNRFLSMLIGAVLFVLSAAAENYPYRSDVLWVTVPGSCRLVVQDRRESEDRGSVL